MIHKNMSIERQAQEVRKVKRSESGMIVDPITLSMNARIGQALDLMAENRIGGIPVVDEHRKLVGILTNRDLRFETDPHRPVSEVMTKVNLITTPAGTSLRQAEGILQEHKIEKLPVVDEEGHLVGLITYKDILKIKDFPMACKDPMGRLRVGAAVGSRGIWPNAFRLWCKQEWTPSRLIQPMRIRGVFWRHWSRCGSLSARRLIW